ncbi:hypothetical protein D9611_006736 [Ephemerocybe angulata]|uniref:Uncharacterized protein n=1 Tax=Ephemerocybe angulata TaxID=980116 RepID=A0A8H5C6Y1_9AGAR|nr:hypothetical protein D9611_006736 [Tulosesus angulatus]
MDSVNGSSADEPPSSPTLAALQNPLLRSLFTQSLSTQSLTHTPAPEAEVELPSSPPPVPAIHQPRPIRHSTLTLPARKPHREDGVATNTGNTVNTSRRPLPTLPPPISASTPPPLSQVPPGVGGGGPPSSFVGGGGGVVAFGRRDKGKERALSTHTFMQGSSSGAQSSSAAGAGMSALAAALSGVEAEEQEPGTTGPATATTTTSVLSSTSTTERDVPVHRPLPRIPPAMAVVGLSSGAGAGVAGGGDLVPGVGGVGNGGKPSSSTGTWDTIGSGAGSGNAGSGSSANGAWDALDGGMVGLGGGEFRFRFIHRGSVLRLYCGPGFTLGFALVRLFVGVEWCTPSKGV